MPEPDIRHEFFAEVHTDPYAAMIAHLYGDAYATGYLRALRDIDTGRPDARFLTHADLRAEAIGAATDATRANEAKLMIALAAVGPTLNTGTPT